MIGTFRRRDKISLALFLLNVGIGVVGLIFVPEERGLAIGWVVLWTAAAISVATPRPRRYTTWRRWCSA
jgi:hypothetical protein